MQTRLVRRSGALSEVLSAFESNPTVVQRNRVLKAFETRGDGYGAVKWIKSLPASLATLNLQAYRSLFCSLDAVRDGQVEVWFQRMVEQSVIPTRDIFEKVFRNMHNSESRTALFTQYKELGFSDDVDIRTDAMTPVARFGFASTLESMISSMAQDGLAPSVATYNLAILAYARRGNAKSHVWFNRIKQAGLLPDKESYSLLVYAAAKEGNPPSAEIRFADIAANGFKHDTTDYNRLLHSYQRIGNEPKAINCYERMLSAGVEPNCMTYNMLIGISGLVLEDGIARGEKWIDKIFEKELTPTIATYNSMLDVCLKQGSREKFTEWWNKMDERIGKTPSSYTLAMSCCAKSGDIEGAKKFLAESHEKFPEDSERHRGFTCVLDAISRSSPSKEEELLEWWKKMEEECGRPSRTAYNIMINYYNQRDNIPMAELYFLKLWESGTKPDIANYNTIIQLYVRNGEFEKCKKIWDVINSEKLTPSHTTWLMMIRVFIGDGDIATARKWLEKCIEKRTIRMDKRLFNALVKGYCDKGELLMAEEMVNMMISEDIRPDDFTMHCIMRAVNIEEWEVADRMMSAIGTAVNEKHYAAIVRLCESADQWERAQFWLDKAESRGMSKLAMERKNTQHIQRAENDAVTWHEIAGSSPRKFVHSVTKEKTETPSSGWVEVKDDDGNSYYWNVETDATQWDYPA